MVFFRIYTITSMLVVSPLMADVQYYQDQAGLNYDFLNIREVGSYGQFIGGNPSPGFKAMSPETLALYPNGSNLNVNAYGMYGYGYGIPVSYVSSQLSFSVKVKNGQEINSVYFQIGGTYDIQYAENPVWGVAKEDTASLSITCPISIQTIAIDGQMVSMGQLLKNYVPSVNFNSLAKTWSIDWSLGDIKALNPEIFTSPSLKITELAVTITPTLSAQTNQGSASAYLNNLSFAVIPEPSALSLLVVGFGVVLRRRRRTV